MLQFFKNGVISMPIKIPDHLPASEILQSENIFVMNESRAYSQDIRPLRIVILNLMPNKEVTLNQLVSSIYRMADVKYGNIKSN